MFWLKVQDKLLKHNRPDIVLWDHKIKTCSVVEVSCPLDINVVRKIQEKEDIYGPLMRSLQIQYPKYTFRFIPVIIGATGYVPTRLDQSMAELGFLEKERSSIIHTLQMIAISGTIKICKTFLKTNAVVILLRTIDQANGMCNGTRLAIQDIGDKVINKYFTVT